MKKSHIRFFSLSFLVACSFFSYVYLSAVSNQQLVDNTANALIDISSEEQQLEEQEDVYLPDVQFLKNALELTRRLIQTVPKI